MLYYVVKRLLAAVLVLVGVTLLAFAMLHLMPGDPVRVLMSSMEASSSQTDIEQVRARFGLNDPLPVQYVNFVRRAVTGDLGRSVLKGRPVATMIAEVYPYTIQLAFAALAIAMLAGISLGVVAALRHNTWADSASIFASLFAVSMPDFWLAILAILVFSIYLGWLPAAGTQGWQYLILPASILGIRAAGSIARLTRSSMLEVLGRQYVTTARAKGLREPVVVLRHALKNALIPVVTLIGLDLGRFLAGSVIVETIFARQGVGKLLIDSILDKDFPVLQGTVLVIAATYVLVNLIVDVSYAWLDPRIRYA
jgi:ABC-type dipeptide/oligopeptide/nickel transport system permease component